MIAGLKFARAQAAAADIAMQMAHLHADMAPTVITHLPTASRRIRLRGYDQSALIARSLAQQLRIPYIPLLIRMSQHRQVGESRAARQAAARNLFRAKTMPLVRRAHVLVVDDVITTGASLEAAASVLRAAGAARVDAITFAAA
ncbi:MAG TPA: phosphoribosyltransferase family protein [Candidatus Saccharimonadales bacterium]|nr:phosphoribosyltransferase family protein [Candidatus Saccharimonadales bacterium]